MGVEKELFRNYIRKREDLKEETIKYFEVKDPKCARLTKTPGRPVISNCGYYTENISAFLYFHQQPSAQVVKSY